MAAASKLSLHDQVETVEAVSIMRDDADGTSDFIIFLWTRARVQNPVSLILKGARVQKPASLISKGARVQKPVSLILKGARVQKPASLILKGARVQKQKKPRKAQSLAGK